jgi:hypothetical protein
MPQSSWTEPQIDVASLLPPSVSSIVTIDYSREAEEIIVKFTSVVLSGWYLQLEISKACPPGEADTAEEFHGTMSEKGGEPFGSQG